MTDGSGSPLRIAVHDYSGHPFQVQLSRELARRGHHIAHLWSVDVSTPRGGLTPRDDDPSGLTLIPVSVGRALPKYALIRRVLQERRYTQLVADAVQAHQPDVVLSCNAPPFIQAGLLRRCRRMGSHVAFISWVQDIYAVALERFLPRLLPGPVTGIARLLAKLLAKVEIGTIHRSDAAIVITEDFLGLLNLVNTDRAPDESGDGVAPVAGQRPAVVIENWAPLPEIPLRPKDNAQARALGVADKTVLMYSGTLGLKHDVSVILALAEAFDGDPEVRILVVSTGMGRKALEAAKRERGFANLILTDFAPYDVLPDMLGSADVFLAILGEDAGVLSVPSKVLSYLCAGRPLLCAMPADNLAARRVLEAQAGVVVPVNDHAALIKAARSLIADPEGRRAMADAARQEAERRFDITAIANRFEAVITQARDPRSP